MNTKNNDFNSTEYLKKKISKKKKEVSKLEKEVNAKKKDIEKITSSKAFSYWVLFNKTKSDIMRNIYPKLLLDRGKTLLRKIKVDLNAKNYITRLENVKVSKNYKISVVIPTYYAESFMPSLLKAISAQKHIEDLDLIIIDSESKDKTQEFAKDFGANVLTIKQNDFTHSLARNIAAKHAKHDLILFTVQDELPAENTTFAKMAELLYLDQNIATVSTRQIARPDADIFARWQVDNHNQALDLNYDSISKINDFNKFSQESFVLQRRVSLLDNVCALYRKDIFTELNGFTEVIFGEDLDYAFKVLKKGYKLGLVCSTGVIHSHNRPAHYFLKRTFVSSMLDLDLLSAVDDSIVINPSLDLIAGLTISEYLSSKQTLSEFSKDDLREFMNKFKFNDFKKSEIRSELSKLILFSLESTNLDNKSISDDDILKYYQNLLNMLDNYLKKHPQIIASIKDRFGFLEKMLGTKIGDTLAKYCLSKQTTEVKINTKILKNILFGYV
ncbi:MAG: glycosyltransferase [Pseudomonadales bacterium]|nr:glycosyltransferase [Pseudomonadales bacterium]